MQYPDIFILALFYDYESNTYFRCHFSYRSFKLDCIQMYRSAPLHGVCVLFPVADCTSGCNLFAPGIPFCSSNTSLPLLLSGDGICRSLLQSQYLLRPRECSGSEAAAALSTEALNSASCQAHELKLDSWMMDMWPRHPCDPQPIASPHLTWQLAIVT